MKRTFLARRNAVLSSAETRWGLGAFVFSLIVLFTRILAPNMFWHMTAPLFAGADALAEGSHAFLSSFSSSAKLTAENEQLADENAALVNENRALAAQVQDISALFATHGESLRGQSLGILAGVVARPPQSSYDSLVLAVGRDAGVVPGMEAFGSGGVPVGIVSTVTNSFSSVLLFSSPGVVTNGWAGAENVPVMVKGTGAGTLRATVSRSVSVSVGDTIFVSGPGRLPIGEVVHIDDDQTASEVTLCIQPAINPFSISWVTLRDTGAQFLSQNATTTLP